MDEVFSKRPDAEIQNVDEKVKTYILLLEKKLKNSISMKKFNKDMERKFLNQQQELKSIKLQQEKSIQNEEIQRNVLQTMLTTNTELIKQNKQLETDVTTLRNKIQELTINHNTKNGKASLTTSNAKKNYQEQLNSIDDNDPDSNSVLVKGLNEEQLNSIPKINIINMGRIMNINIMEKDIVKVSMLESKYHKRHNLKPNKIILIVQFLTPELKVDFLKNKEKLKNDHPLADVEIIDYVSDEVYNLYQYAKVLKTYGYAQIYWRNNCVYAKETRSTYCEPILIKSKNDVDGLKKYINKK